MRTNLAPSASLPFELGEARSFGGLTLVPLYPAGEPRAEYVGLDEASATGLTVTELNEAGAVETLLAVNPLGTAALLYEGEELAGAKQNRVLERSILVAAGSKLEIPAKCVEQGRWAYRSRRFAPAPRAAHPELRRLRHDLGAPSQHAVWGEVSAKSARLGVRSATGGEHAYLEGNELVLEDFRESDPDVVGFVRDADEPEAAVHRCLTMGARVLRVAGATLDTELVEHRFDEMTGELDRSIEGFAKRVDESAESLLDSEDGKLALALNTWLDEVETTLDATFDENSKKSAIAKLEKVLEDARAEQVAAVRRLLDPDNDESPIARWRSEIVNKIGDQGKSIEDALDGLREQLAIKGAAAQEHEKAAVKGFDFEDVVLAALTPIVTPHEDVPEHVGNETGDGGTKVGDIVVTINPEETPGRAVRYVVEAKDKSLILKKALDELDAAMRNRNAEAAIMVFARQDVCPSKEPFQPFDHKAIVVLDKEELDVCALRLACLWARWTARREEAEAIESVDPARVQTLIDAARLSLKPATTIRGDHTKARTAIDHATQHLEGLVSDLKGTLDQLESEIAGAS
jgi:hypothetical protein